MILQTSSQPRRHARPALQVLRHPPPPQAPHGEDPARPEDGHGRGAVLLPAEEEGGRHHGRGGGAGRQTYEHPADRGGHGGGRAVADAGECGGGGGGEDGAGGAGGERDGGGFHAAAGHAYNLSPARTLR